MRLAQQFQIEACIGRGGYGEVYRAVMTSPGGLRKRVAIKTLRDDMGPNVEAVQRLRDEARLLALLNHPNIINVLDLLVIRGRVSVLMEYVKGEDLSKMTRAEPRMSPRAVMQVVGQVANALDAANTSPLGPHGAPLGLVHRDIKPSNIRITPQGAIKVLDFGTARAPNTEREAKTGTGLVLGTIGYLAPERLDEGEPSSQSDVYSVGCVLFELLTGEPLFPKMSSAQFISKLVDESRHSELIEERLDLLDLSVPVGVRMVLDNTLAYVPQNRLTMSELARHCDELSSRLRGKSLRAWCANYPFSERTVVSGEWIGMKLQADEIPASKVENTKNVVDKAGEMPTLEDQNTATSGLPRLFGDLSELPDLDALDSFDHPAGPKPSGGLGVVDSTPSPKAPSSKGAESEPTLPVSTSESETPRPVVSDSGGSSLESGPSEVGPQPDEPDAFGYDPKTGTVRMGVLGLELPLVWVGSLVAAALAVVMVAGLAVMLMPGQQRVKPTPPPPEPLVETDTATADTDTPQPTLSGRVKRWVWDAGQGMLVERWEPAAKGLPDSLNPKKSSANQRLAFISRSINAPQMDRTFFVVLQTDPSREVKNAAWQALTRRYSSTVGNATEIEGALVYAAQRLDARRQKRAVQLLCRHPASLAALRQALATQDAQVRAQLVYECDNWMVVDLQEPGGVTWKTLLQAHLETEQDKNVIYEIKKTLSK